MSVNSPLLDAGGRKKFILIFFAILSSGWIGGPATWASCDISVSMQYASEPCRQERRAAFIEALRLNLPAGPLSQDHQAIVNAILAGKLLVGMSKEEAEASWGEPYPINRTTGPWGVHEQWVYHGYGVSGSYVYFENGKLTAWQDQNAPPH